MPVPSPRRNKGHEEATQRMQVAASQPLVDPFALDEQEIIGRCLSENSQQQQTVRNAFYILQLSLWDYSRVECPNSAEMSELIAKVSLLNRQLGTLKAEMKRLESDRVKLGGSN
jgi:hypothetical protein